MCWGQSTFSFCCDLTAISLSCSLFNLASSSSCCLAAITASSFATSSCWALHCRSYKHTCKYTSGRNKQKKPNRILAINSYLESITHRETTSWVPQPWHQRCQGCLSHLVLDRYRTHQIFLNWKRQCLCALIQQELIQDVRWAPYSISSHVLHTNSFNWKDSDISTC